MSQKSEDLLTVLDAGSSKIRVLVAELHEGALRYRAHSVVNADGMRKGLISDLQPASRAFNHAATEAERMASGEYTAPTGELTVTAPISLGRTHLIPILADFLKTSFP